MSLEAARREVVQEIATAHEAMRESRTARVLGTYREKVTAAGEIELLKRQLAMLDTRLAEIDSERSAEGSVIGWFYDRAAERARDPEFVKRMGVLMATGMIVGDSLFGVLYAGIVYETGSESPLALVGPGFAGVALAGGTALFLAITAGLYLYTKRQAR